MKKQTEDLKKEYRDLEMKVLNRLRNKINESKIESNHISGKAIKVDIDGYTELVVLHDRLVLLDRYGYSYGVFNISLEELIDILNN